MTEVSIKGKNNFFMCREVDGGFESEETDTTSFSLRPCNNIPGTFIRDTVKRSRFPFRSTPCLQSFLESFKEEIDGIFRLWHILCRGNGQFPRLEHTRVRPLVVADAELPHPLRRLPLQRGRGRQDFDEIGRRAPGLNPVVQRRDNPTRRDQINF